MEPGRVLFADLHLLDRQLVDRDERLCGKIDDLELTETSDGGLFVSAIVTGPGALWRRLHRRTLGDWVRSLVPILGPGDGDAGRIPFGRVIDVGDHVSLAVDRSELATDFGERWVREHVISKIPGSRHDAAD
jgi:hypothetical protein